MTIILFPVLICLIGLLMYVVCKDGKLAEVGRIMFFVGLWLSMFGAPALIRILAR